MKQVVSSFSLQEVIRTINNQSFRKIESIEFISDPEEEDFKNLIIKYYERESKDFFKYLELGENQLYCSELGLDNKNCLSNSITNKDLKILFTHIYLSIENLKRNVPEILEVFKTDNNVKCNFNVDSGNFTIERF